MSDINDLLLKTNVSEILAAKRAEKKKNKKRLKDDIEKNAEDESKSSKSKWFEEQKRRLETENAKDSKPDNKEQSAKFFEKLESAALVRSVMRFVMEVELGGKMKALQHSAPDDSVNSCQLDVEVAKLSADAKLDTNYIVRATAGEGLYVCEVDKKPLSSAALSRMEQYELCDARTDLVGPVSSKKNVLIQEQNRKLIESALKGEKYVPQLGNIFLSEGAESKEPSSGGVLNIFAPAKEANVSKKETTMKDLFDVSSDDSD